jgi:hypothetical protein
MKNTGYDPFRLYINKLSNFHSLESAIYTGPQLAKARHMGSLACGPVLGFLLISHTATYQEKGAIERCDFN